MWKKKRNIDVIYNFIDWPQKQFAWTIYVRDMRVLHATCDKCKGLVRKGDGFNQTSSMLIWLLRGLYMYYCYFSSVFVMMVTYLLLAGLLVTLLPSTLATSLYARDRQAFGLCYEEDCLSAHFSYNPYGCHGKVSSIIHVHVFYLRSLKDDYF